MGRPGRLRGRRRRGGGAARRGRCRHGGPGADYRWLDFPDHQYLLPADRPKPADVAPVLGATIAELDPTSVFFPMGLGNPDHVMVHEASLLVREQQPDREWFCYEDHGYKHIPGLLAWRVTWPVAAPAPLAHPCHRPPRARRGAQAPRHLVLHVADPAARARPRVHGAHGGTCARAISGAWRRPRKGGRRSPTSSRRGARHARRRPARGEYGRVVRRTSVTAEVFVVTIGPGPGWGGWHGHLDAPLLGPPHGRLWAGRPVVQGIRDRVHEPETTPKRRGDPPSAGG